MVTFEINGSRRSGSEITPKWITEQFKIANTTGNLPCVRVEIDAPECKMPLRTPVCPQPVGGGGRAPTACEDQVFVLWDRNHLNTARYTQGNVIAFLNQLKSLF